LYLILVEGPLIKLSVHGLQLSVFGGFFSFFHPYLPLSKAVAAVINLK